MLDNVQPKIAFIIRQPGTANAFVPLIHFFQKEGWDSVVLAYENGAKLLNEKEIAHQKIDNFQDSLPYLKGSQILLTGTSLFVEDDNKYWSWATKNDINAIAFVDSWVNYWQRFTIKDKWDATPNFIAVVDELMRKRMLERGAKQAKLLVTGSPAFDSLISQEKTISKNSAKKEILIITDPLFGLYGEATKEKIGYTEFEVMDFIFDSLSKILGKQQKDYSITIKIHPREAIESYEKYQNTFENQYHQIQIIAKTANNIKLIQRADLILGMNSILLLEASILGQPVLSFQPNRKVPNDITDGKVGIDVFTDWEKGFVTLKNRLNGNLEEFKVVTIDYSMPKFAAILKKMVFVKT